MFFSSRGHVKLLFHYRLNIGVAWAAWNVAYGLMFNNGLFQKEIVPPVFPVKFTVTPMEFSIFLHKRPWKSMFSSQFNPLKFQRLLLYPLDFYSTPWNFPLITSTGELQFFSGKAPFVHLHQHQVPVYQMKHPSMKTMRVLFVLNHYVQTL